MFRQGDKAAAIFRVEAGRVRLVRQLEDGSSVTLHVARAGESFAEAALFAGSYHCDAVAEIDGSILVVPKADLLATLTREPAASLGYARHLSSQVRDLRTLVELRNIRSAPGRLLAWLQLKAAGDPLAVKLDRPWTEIAPELGLTHESVYRALATLEKDRLIRRQKDMILIILARRGTR